MYQIYNVTLFVNKGVRFTHKDKLLESVPTFLGSYIAWNATGWTVRGSNPGGGEIFSTLSDWPCGLYNGYRLSLSGVKRPGRGDDHPPHLLPSLKKEQSYTSTPPLDLRGLFQPNDLQGLNADSNQKYELLNPSPHSRLLTLQIWI